MKWLSKLDLIMIAALLCAALLLLMLRNGGGENGARFEILSGSNIIYTGLLTMEREFNMEGHPNVSLTVRSGKIAFTQSDCRDKTCIRTGYIGIPGQITACLPNGLVVRISGDYGVDAVV